MNSGTKSSRLCGYTPFIAWYFSIAEINGDAVAFIRPRKCIRRLKVTNSKDMIHASKKTSMIPNLSWVKFLRRVNEDIPINTYMTDAGIKYNKKKQGNFPIFTSTKEGMEQKSGPCRVGAIPKKMRKIEKKPINRAGLIRFNAMGNV
jgi:hypothetical protein